MWGERARVFNGGQEDTMGSVSVRKTFARAVRDRRADPARSDRGRYKIEMDARSVRGASEGRDRGLRRGEMEEWTDGSRGNERAAGATRMRGMYLGTMTTVADAEEVGVMLAWGEKDTVALDSQGVIQRIWSLQYITPRSWTEETLKKQMQTRPKTLMLVKGHRGIEGNEKADERGGRG